MKGLAKGFQEKMTFEDLFEGTEFVDTISSEIIGDTGTAHGVDVKDQLGLYSQTCI